jgi:hypothetical protein
MRQLLPVFAVAFLLLSISGNAENQALFAAESVCDPTPPNGIVADLDASFIREVFGVSPRPEHLRRFHSYGNRLLSVGPFGLGQSGVTTGRPDPTIAVGWIHAKFSWMRAVKGHLKIAGQRIDGDAPPLQARIPDGYGEIGFQPSGLMFSTPGCWRITAQIGDLTDSRLTFVTKIQIPKSPDQKY